MISGLFFDLDGVVIDSESYSDKSCEYILDKFGKPYDRDILKPQMVGKSDIEGMNILVKHHKLPITGEEFDQKRKVKKKEFYRDEIPFMNGFLGFFQQIRSKMNIPVAIVTACKKEYFELIDERLKISELFDNNIFRSDMVARHKPEPDVYLYAAEQLNINIKKSLVFEDSPSGIVSGIRAGAKVIAITTTFSQEQLVEHILKTDGSINIKDILFISEFTENTIAQILV